MTIEQKKPESEVAQDVRAAIAGLHKLWGAGNRMITPEQHKIQVEFIKAKIIGLKEENDPAALELVDIFNKNLAGFSEEI